MVGAIGGIRLSATLAMELFDSRTGRSLKHHYDIDVLPDVALGQKPLMRFSGW